jgi:dTDP-glucose 4,6-dehydratase/UDP-glucose 4-epimerase
VCINASGSGSVPYSFDNPEEDYRLNAKNVFDILTAISRFNTRCRFLNFSSAAVYGNPSQLPISESEKTKPVSPYGFHKLISEQMCAEFYHLKKIKSCSMRVFSAYGEGLRKQLLWDIYQKSLKSLEIELFGTGDETRDFIHIRDLLSALECILDKSNFESDIVNLGTGIPTTIRETAELFASVIHPEVRIRFTGTSKAGDPLHLQADISKLKSFGFETSVGLQRGIDEYYQWVKQ